MFSIDTFTVIFLKSAEIRYKKHNEWHLYAFTTINLSWGAFKHCLSRFMKPGRLVVLGDKSFIFLYRIRYQSFCLRSICNTAIFPSLSLFFLFLSLTLAIPFWISSEASGLTLASCINHWTSNRTPLDRGHDQNVFELRSILSTYHDLHAREYTWMCRFCRLMTFA